MKEELKETVQYDNVVVHLDNGHASSTPGKKSPYALYKIKPELDFREWKFNREIVQILKEMLESHGITVDVVVPEDDEDIKLSARYTRANTYKSNCPEKKHLFISVHANACGDGKEWNSARGWCAYTTKGQNNSDVLAECLYDCAEEEFLPLGLKIRSDKSDGDRDYEENFTVIYGANMPAVLTENFFYTNIEDTKFLLSDEGKQLIAKVHCDGILRFCEKMKY